MRRFDKTKNILKANLLAEQRYLESKGLIKEGIDDNPVDSRRQEYDDYEAGQQDYEERQKLKNMPSDNIIYNIVQNGADETYSFNSNDTGTAKIEVYGNNEEVIATYYFELADLKDLDNRPWVGLANVSLGDNASISKEAEEYITDMIENSDKLVQSHNQYVNDNHEEPENDFYDRHERLDENIDDKTLLDNIDDLLDYDIHPITSDLPSQYSDGNPDKVLIGLLNVIKKVNPNANIENKKISLKRAFDETMQDLNKAAWAEHTVTMGVKEYFRNNLQMFK